MSFLTVISIIVLSGLSLALMLTLAISWEDTPFESSGEYAMIDLLNDCGFNIPFEKEKISSAIILIAPIIVAYWLTLRHIVNFFIINRIKNFKRKQFLKKRVYSLTDIYEFKKGDIISLKNGDSIYLNEFAPSGFTNSSKQIFSWDVVLENKSYENRKEENKNRIKYEAFKSEQIDFSKKVEEYQKQMDEYRNKILKE